MKFLCALCLVVCVHNVACRRIRTTEKLDESVIAKWEALFNSDSIESKTTEKPEKSFTETAINKDVIIIAEDIFSTTSEIPHDELVIDESNYRINIVGLPILDKPTPEKHKPNPNEPPEELTDYDNSTAEEPDYRFQSASAIKKVLLGPEIKIRSIDPQAILNGANEYRSVPSLYLIVLFLSTLVNKIII